ncbi:MAG: hypothetical protein LBM96_12135 [Methanobrevibacter sp.]|jgi:predicted nucleic acid-binding protein|nr:hypothetical protein [Candidatus Methanoflexus mossambicus]
MWNINLHFLDTNIILGNIFPDENNENYLICKEYFKNDIQKKYISERVKNEAIEVISRKRRISTKLLDFAEEFIFNNNEINPSKSELSINKLKKDFLNKYSHTDFPEGIPKENFNKIINDLFSIFHDSIYNDLISKNNSNILNNKKDIKETFRFYIKDLNYLISTLNCDNYYIEDKYNDLEKSIDNTEIHKADKLILLDYYELIKVLNKNVGFITQDKTIIKYKENISKIFKDIDCKIFLPNDYIKLTNSNFKHN